jgi:hypothetical protein
MPSTDHYFLFVFPPGSAHHCEKGSKGFLTRRAPKRQYFDDLSINDQKHVDFISFRTHLGMKTKGERACLAKRNLPFLKPLKWFKMFSGCKGKLPFSAVLYQAHTHLRVRYVQKVLPQWP